jgi:hypothetical protein
MKITFSIEDIEQAILAELENLSLYGEKVVFNSDGTASVDLLPPPKSEKSFSEDPSATLELP